MSNAALVYGTSDSQARLSAYLIEQELYRWDDAVETDVDLGLSPDLRPVLRRLLMHAQIASAMGPSDGPAPRHFVADGLTQLGPDRSSQVAVVGALMELGFIVHADYRVLGRDWYDEQVKEVGFHSFGNLQGSLLDSDRIDTGMVQKWQSAWTGPSWFIPSSRQPRKGEASARVRQLVDVEGYSFTGAARQLRAEGYPNSQGRMAWYTRNVRRAYEVGQ